jgi:membrane-associated phospholipid phosphatase
VGLNLLIGREGPRPDAAEPQTYGPGVGFRLYPSGAPSGHATTLYSLMSAGFAWFEPPVWLQVTGHLLVGGLVAFHAIDHRHYASDLVWGGAMGWYVGQWVVKHRASRPESGREPASPPVQAAVVPVALPGGAGAAVVVRY